MSAQAPIQGPQDFAAAFNVSRETIERLQAYEAKLQRWQKAKNLVSAETLTAVWQRHFADSAQLVPLAPGDARVWLDLGSGAGFPGLVVAILVANRSTKVHLVESNARKCAFLAEAARAAEVAVEIHQCRVESMAVGPGLAADVVSARALAPLPRLFELAHPLFSSATVGLFPKGRTVEDELAAADQHWSFDAELIPSRTDRHARIIRLTALAPRGRA